MKKTKLLLFSILLSAQGFAQQYLYTDPTLASNIYPFSNTSVNFRQSIYHAANFPTAPSGTITAIYLLKSTNTTTSFTDMTIKMGHTTLTNFPSTSYITGLQTVYTGPYSEPTVNGNYIKIALQTPFTYDSTQNFVVELSQGGYSSGTSIMQANNGQVSRRTMFGSSNNTTGTVQDRLPVLGIDVTTTLGTVEQHFYNSPEIYPNPTSDNLYVKSVSDGANYKIMSTQGAIVAEGKLKNQKIDVSGFTKGIYFISITEKGKEVIQSKFIKK